MINWGDNINKNLSIIIAEKEIEKSIINELFEKNIIDFYQCNSIIKKLEEDIIKIKLNIDNEKTNMIVEIPI